MIMKPKTLLFGAGQGCRPYMQNNLSSRNFVGFLDNDKKKHGTLFEGLPVYSPELINTLLFDEIVISTQWALEVQHQLVHVLGVDADKVILPQKNQLKKITPFEHPKTICLARDIVKIISSIALQTKVPIVIDFGTLLGITRDNDIIEWDDDIDFAAPIEASKQVEKLLVDFVSENRLGVAWRLERQGDSQNNISGLLLKFSDPTGTLTEFITSVSFRQNINGKSLHMPSLGMWFAPQEHFNGFSIIEWLGQEIPVPLKHEAYLTFQYGDWQTPKKDIQLSDYANLQTVEFADVQRASLTVKEIEFTTSKDELK
jgi:lipopolysaccharide cholinephosphotransferase